MPWTSTTFAESVTHYTAAIGNNTELGISEAKAAAALALLKASNLADLASAPAARTSLGLGTAAVKPEAFFTTPAQAEVIAAKGACTAQVLTAQKGTVNLDLSKYNVFQVEINGVTTFTFINAPAAPMEVTLIVKQDSVGGRTFTITGAEWVGAQPTWETTPGTRAAIQVFLTAGAAEKLAWAKSAGSIGAGSAQIQLFGANISAFSKSTEAQNIQEIGVNTAAHAKLSRCNATWMELEPTKGAALEPVKLARLDKQINLAAEGGQKTILTVVGTPAWASTGKLWNNMPLEPSLYGAFCKKMVERYGSKLACIEIWNEPNPIKDELLSPTNTKWSNAERAKGYTELVKAAHEACAGLGVPVVMGSFSYFNKGANGETWLGELYANGIKGFYEGISVHPYGEALAPESEAIENTFKGGLVRLNAYMEAHGDTTKVWVTEFGYFVGEGSMSETTRADYMKKSFELMQTMPYVAGGVWFQVRDGPSGKFGFEQELTPFTAYEPIFAKYQEAMKAIYG